MDRNIQESKEYRLAKEWEMAVNSYSFDPRKFAAAIPGMHPTNQQSLYRLIRECIKVMADDSRRRAAQAVRLRDDGPSREGDAQ